jgi:F0F1-type ATP synthase, delta subunit (mitochondrial oligomycin sensitivity protein)
VADKDALVRSYAEALFRLAEAEGELDAVERQLFAFAALLERETRVRDALVDPSLPPENKKQADRGHARRTRQLPRGQPARVRHRARTCPRGRPDRRGAREVVAATRERAVAEVRTAVALDEARAKKLTDALSKAAGRPIEIRVIVDPDVLGGVLARVGDEIFDGSVRTRLQEAREQLTGTTTRSG